MTERHAKALKTTKEQEHSEAIEKKNSSHKDALAKKDESRRSALERKVASHNRTKLQLAEKKKDLKKVKEELSSLKRQCKELENDNNKLNREVMRLKEHNTDNGSSKMRSYIEKKEIDLHFKERGAQRQLEIKDQKEHQKIWLIRRGGEQRRSQQSASLDNHDIKWHGFKWRV